MWNAICFFAFLLFFQLIRLKLQDFSSKLAQRYIPFDGNSNRTLTYLQITVGLSGLSFFRQVLWLCLWCNYLSSYFYNEVFSQTSQWTNHAKLINVGSYTHFKSTFLRLTDFQSLEHGFESKIGLMGKSSFISKKPITSMENCDWKNVYLCDRYTGMLASRRRKKAELSTQNSEAFPKPIRP